MKRPRINQDILIRQLWIGTGERGGGHLFVLGRCRGEQPLIVLTGKIVHDETGSDARSHSWRPEVSRIDANVYSLIIRGSGKLRLGRSGR
ncbi:MAG: hypothetical protein BRD30_04040 [Bacteroidetes bacterium QH_2_63_10]|nr:MAG: hypothetical protein BRD30_04040 [Bacteroidetes bacterium QH_2_63_10]